MRSITIMRSLRLLGVVGAVAGLMFAAMPQASAQKKFDNTKIRIATFPGTWEIRIREEVGPAMEKAGIEMEFVGGRTEAFLSKLIAARGQEIPFDVVEITDHVLQEFLQAGFLQKINLANIPNRVNVQPEFIDDWKVGYWMHVAAIQYNTAKFKEHGIPFPTSHADLLNPKLKGHIGMPSPFSYNMISHIVSLAYANGGDEANIEPGMKALEKYVPQIHSWVTGTVMSQLIKSGDVWASFGSAGGSLRLISAGLPMAVAHVKVKDASGMPSVGYMGAVKGTKVAEAIDFFLNELVGVEMQEGMYLQSGLIPTNKNVLAKHWKVAPKDTNGGVINIMDPAEMAKFYFIDYSKINRAKWAKRLARVQAMN
jgi:ABC-type Fe3+ transport system substrate-binding protein